LKYVDVHGQPHAARVLGRRNRDCYKRSAGLRIVQLMLGHASIQQRQRYPNVTDEELRKGLEVSWNNKGRPPRLASGS
jgi:integrase